MKSAWQMQVEERRRKVAELRAEGLSYRAIGERLGVTAWTAHRDVMKQMADNQPSHIVGKDGKRHPAYRGGDTQTARGAAGIYFVRCFDMVKIGYSSNVAARLRRLEKMNAFSLTLLAIIEGGIPAERRLHKRFAKYRVHDEWFAIEGELAEYLEQLK